MADLLAYDSELARQAGADGVAPRVVTLKAIAAAAARLLEEPSLLLDNQREAFLLLHRGDVGVCPIQTLPTPAGHALLAGPDAQVCVKTGYAKGDAVFCVKIAAGGGTFAGNTGMMQIFCQKTLRLQCVLQDEGLLTEMRTAAAACLASSLLMPKDVTKVGLVGGSVQAIWHLRFLAAIVTTRRCVVRTRSQASAAAFRDQMRASPCALDREWSITTYEEEREKGVERPFAKCALIHTVSCARQPVLTAADLGRAGDKQGVGPVHISAIGADAPGKQELGEDLVAAADFLVCDLVSQSKERGEFQHYLARHAGSPPTPVVELGALLADAGRLQRLRPEESEVDTTCSIFDSSGVAVQDVGIARLISGLVKSAGAELD